MDLSVGGEAGYMSGTSKKELNLKCHCHSSSCFCYPSSSELLLLVTYSWSLLLLRWFSSAPPVQVSTSPLPLFSTQFVHLIQWTSSPLLCWYWSSGSRLSSFRIWSSDQLTLLLLFLYQSLPLHTVESKICNQAMHGSVWRTQDM